MSSKKWHPACFGDVWLVVRSNRYSLEGIERAGGFYLTENDAADVADQLNEGEGE